MMVGNSGQQLESNASDTLRCTIQDSGERGDAQAGREQEIYCNLYMAGKGAPASECRTSTRLVSPAIGREKNIWTLLKIRHPELIYTLSNVPERL